MRTGMRRVSCLFLVVCVLSSMMFPAFASEQEGIVEESKVWIPSDDIPASEELYSAYLEKLFYGEGTATFATLARDHLNPLGQKLYDHLKEHIAQVAAGESVSTTVRIEKATLLSWGAQLTFETTVTSTVFSKFLAQFETEQVMTALLHDCPYELYWFDKVEGMYQRGGIAPAAQSCSVTYVSFSFCVAGDWQSESYSEETPAIDISRVSKATQAAANAKNILDAHKNKSDYEKLLAYKEEICDLVSYDYSAANSGNFSDNAAPWQLIHVFDGDSKTNVVCEGYSKAFKYLCDMTRFTGPVACYSVSGAFASSGSGEPHMWNIVSVGSDNYLVDVTNSDSGTVGSDGSLFMAGGTGSITGGYAVSRCMYAYDTDNIALWGEGKDSILFLSSSKYDPNAQPPVEEEHSYKAVITPPTCTEDGYTTYTCACGDSYVDDYVKKLGHTGGAATCLKKAVCTRCGAEYGELDIDNHTYKHTVVPPTCTESGYDVYTCECGDSYTQGHTEPTGHKNSISGTVTPTVSSAGELTISCEVCGNTYKVYLPKLSEADYTYSVEIKPTVNSEGIGRYTWKNTGYGEIWFDVPLEKLTFTPGDLNGDGNVNDEDVILLLWHTLLSDMYPIQGDADFNADGNVNDEDVIYLLWHTLLPEYYPL